MEFLDKKVRDLDPKQPQSMIRLVGMLCGEPLNPSDTDAAVLQSMLTDADKINYEQLNEVLLLLNQDRISRHFYAFFFCPESGTCDAINLEQLSKGIERFRGFAMLCFGNFRFAFRKLRTAAPDDFDKEVKRYCTLGEDEIKRKFRSRPAMAVNIEQIERAKTWYVGYLSGANLLRDQLTLMAIEIALRQTTKEKVSQFIKNHVRKQHCDRAGVTTIDGIAVKYGEDARQRAEGNVSQQAEELVEKVVKTAGSPGLDAESWSKKLHDARKVLTRYSDELEDTRKRAKKNTDIYLTWDYMDVYIATSMREKWEYEKAFDFARKVFSKDGPLGDLNLRFFDPTQSYCPGRIDKGLIEGLMLKRAKCTVYLAQETDTLGKDSELASTLAQGKPVIAYVPEFENFEEAFADVAKQPLVFHYKRWLLLEAEDIFSEPAFLDELEQKFKSRLEEAPTTHAASFLGRKNELFDRLRGVMSRRTFNLLIPMKVVTDSDLIPVSDSDAMPVAIGAKRRWPDHSGRSDRHPSTGMQF